MRNTSAALAAIVAVLAFVPTVAEAQTAMSSLTAATATNDINNVNYQQEWEWNSLTSGNGLYLFSGLVTVTNSTGASTPGLIDVTNSGSTKGYDIGNGTWYTTAIPYLRPTDTNGSIAFDIMPNGTAATTWEDICSTDIVADSTDYECLHLTKQASNIAIIQTTASGTGTARDIQIQPTATNAQRVLIGGDTSPTGKVEIVQDGSPWEANFGLSILSASADTALAFGAYAGNYSYIQSEQRAKSWTNRPLVLMPNGGSVGVDTTRPSYTLQVNGSVAGTSAYVNTSDIRYKKNVHPLDAGLNIVSQLKPLSFEWAEDALRDYGQAARKGMPVGSRRPLPDPAMQGTQIGFSAQDVEKVLPSVVVTEPNPEKTKGIKYSEFIPVLTKAIQELKAANDKEAADIAALRQEVAALPRIRSPRIARK